MANGDPLRVGIAQPPDNRATSATVLVHNGSSFGDQRMAFWVQRLGNPKSAAAIRGDNFSTGPAAGQTPAGVLGMTTASSESVGVLGVASGPPNLFTGETGVMGVTSSFGVVGKSLTGLIPIDDDNFVSGTGVVGHCDAGVGVHGVATSGWGVIGQSDSRAGVTGKSVTGIGVEARSQQSNALQANAQSGVGVLGESVSNNGVLGNSRDAIGVEGSSQQGFAGVRGRSDRFFGVIGASNQGVGVAGVSATNAIYGLSTGTGGASIGVVGVSNAGAGVQGDSNSGIGVAGRSASGWAGYFEGNVIVRGGFHVTGAKSAAIQHPDGTHRLLYCLESPESYFEDFGETVLAGASVEVKLDKDFAALVKRNDYQVFLTSYGPEALYVRKRAATGFEIARLHRGAAGKFRRMRVGYRIVARRADIKRARLPKIKLPKNVARVAQPALSIGKTGLSPSNERLALAKLDPLPATPKTTLPNLKNLVREGSIRARRTTRRGTPKVSKR